VAPARCTDWNDTELTVVPVQEMWDQLHGDEAAGDQSGGHVDVVLSQDVRKATSDEGEAAEDAAKRRRWRWRWSKRRGRGRRGRWRRRMGLGDGCNGKGKGGSRMKKWSARSWLGRCPPQKWHQAPSRTAACLLPWLGRRAMISMETDGRREWIQCRGQGGSEEETRRRRRRRRG